MASENTVVHMGENSPEQVGYRLLEIVADLEKRGLKRHLENPADRKWVLDTYAECLFAVRGYRKWDK